MKNKKKILAIIVVLLSINISRIFILGDGLALVRNIDILQIFSLGLLTGLLIAVARGIYLNSK